VNRRALSGVASVLCAAACLSRSPTLEPDIGATLFVRDVPLDTERIEVHLVRAAGTGGRRPLLLYATGDGGWRSADRGLFQHLARWGYPVAGFSARHYLEHLGFEATTRAHVAEDYGHLIAFAKYALELPGDTPTVLVGFSRGSGLAVVAAGQPELQPLLSGVLAVALTDEEEYVREHGTRAGRDRRDVSAPERAALRPYDQLTRLDRLPVAVIQSTQDGYLPAAQARQLFGPDDERRRFHAIRAGNHTFAGARDALYEQARVALEWIVACGPGTEPAQTRPMP
jgi:Bacterial virulence protein (VirJ)